MPSQLLSVTRPSELHSKAHFDESVYTAGIQPLGQCPKIVIARDDDCLSVAIRAIDDQGNRLSGEFGWFFCPQVVKQKRIGIAKGLENFFEAPLSPPKGISTPQQEFLYGRE